MEESQVRTEIRLVRLIVKLLLQSCYFYSLFKDREIRPREAILRLCSLYIMNMQQWQLLRTMGDHDPIFKVSIDLNSNHFEFFFRLIKPYKLKNCWDKCNLWHSFWLPKCLSPGHPLFVCNFKRCYSLDWIKVWLMTLTVNVAWSQTAIFFLD